MVALALLVMIPAAFDTDAPKGLRHLAGGLALAHAATAWLFAAVKGRGSSVGKARDPAVSIIGALLFWAGTLMYVGAMVVGGIVSVSEVTTTTGDKSKNLAMPVTLLVLNVVLLGCSYLHMQHFLRQDDDDGDALQEHTPLVFGQQASGYGGAHARGAAGVGGAPDASGAGPPAV